MNKRLDATMKKINYLETEIEWQQSVLQEQHLNFDQFWREWCAKNDINPPNIGEPQKPQESSQKPAELEQKPISEETKLGREHFKATYKQLAKAVHPDKNGGNDEDFKALNYSWQEGKWSIIITLCIKHDIKIHNAKEVNRLLQKEAKDLEDMIKKNEGMYSWKFWECGDDEECKERLIRHFMNTVNHLKGAN